MTKTRRFLALLAAVATVASSGALAQAQTGNDQARALEFVRLSRQLHDIALETSDPLMMLAAARLRRNASLTVGEIGVLEPEEGEQAAQEDAFDWQGWLDRAVKMSGGSATIAGLAEDIRADKSKGAWGGGFYSKAHVKARDSRKYSDVRFVGGEFADVYAEGAGSADIDMFIYDRKGALVCSQTDASNVNQCGWTPPETGPFSIIVENKSDFGTDYSLMSN